MSNVKDDLHNMLVVSAKRLLDAADMVNDGPDDSDMGLVQSWMNEAVQSAKDWKGLYKETYGMEP